MTTRKTPAPRLPAPPRDLSASSRHLWAEIVARFELRPEHLAQLRLGLEALDRCDQARTTLAKDGLTIVGARGTIQRHPLIDVELQSRTAALRAFRQLGLDQYVQTNQGRDSHGRFE